MVVAAPDSLEARFGAVGVCGQSRLHRFQEQRLTGELLGVLVDRAYPHRLPSQFEHHGHGFKHRAHLGWSGPRFARIGQGFTEQLVVERGYPR